MAAAAVAVNHKNRRSDLNDPIARLVESMPTGDEVLLEGTMGRQVVSAVGNTWMVRNVVVTADELFISKVGSPEVLDQIPLHEVSLVVSKPNDSSDSFKAKKQGSAWGVVRGSMKSLGSKQEPVARTSSKPDTPGTPTNMLQDMDDDVDPHCIIVIHTVAGGYNSGRSTVLLAGSVHEANMWVNRLSELSTSAYKAYHKKPDLGRVGNLQRKCAQIYQSNQVQYFIAAIIGASYISALVGAQILPEKGTDAARNMWIVEVTFTVIFTLELFFNLFGAWWRPFVKDVWNWIDTFVVVISIAGLVNESLPAVNVLRLVRVAKLVKLFRRLKSLRMLINALTSSIVPVLNAFAILLLVTTVYAVVATDLFGDHDPVHFANFFESLFSLFQMATGDSWGSVITRGLLMDPDSKYSGGFVGVFFVSYILIVGVVLMNIVVAVLLGPDPVHTRKHTTSAHARARAHTHTHTHTHSHTHTHADEFITTVAQEKADQKALKDELRRRQDVESVSANGSLDPLVRGLMGFTTEKDLLSKIHALYCRMDLDESGSINLTELNEGLNKIRGGTQLRVSPEDFQLMTEHGRFLNDEGELGMIGFQHLVVSQMRTYANRKITEALNKSEDETSSETLFALRMIMSNIDHINSRLDRLDPTKVETKEKTKKNIIVKLMKASMVHAFREWKWNVHGDSLDDEGDIPKRINKLEDMLAAVAAAVFDIKARVRLFCLCVCARERGHFHYQHTSDT